MLSFHFAKRTNKFWWTFFEAHKPCEKGILSENEFFPPSEMEKMLEWWSSWEKKPSLSAAFGALFSFLLFNTWLEAGLRLQLHPPSRYYGNTIWAYQDLKPKDILDNNTIAAQPGYLRDLDLRAEIWGVADWESKSSLFLYLPHTQTQSGLAFCLGGSGTIRVIELFLCLSFYWNM